jgi:hypothetical protein
MDIDLEKKSEKISIILDKKGIKNAPVLRVGIAYDVSYSMTQFSETQRQQAFNQMMGVAAKFDDNGELDVFKFDNSCSYVGTSKPDKGDYDTYLKRKGIVPSGGTSYKPIVAEAIKFFFGGGGLGGMFSKAVGKTSDVPVLMLIITDGEPGDAAEAMRAMQEASDKPIYFHMVGIGGERKNFPTIAKMADALDNVGEVYLPRFDMTDDELYPQLICDELIEFLAKHTKPVFGRNRP